MIKINYYLRCPVCRNKKRRNINDLKTNYLCLDLLSELKREKVHRVCDDGDCVQTHCMNNDEFKIKQKELKRKEEEEEKNEWLEL